MELGISTHLNRRLAVRRDTPFSLGGKKLKVSVALPPACEYMWCNCLHFKSLEQVGVGAIGIIWLLPYQQQILFTGGNKFFMLKMENMRRITVF